MLCANVGFREFKFPNTDHIIIMNQKRKYIRKEAIPMLARYIEGSNRYIRKSVEQVRHACFILLKTLFLSVCIYYLYYTLNCHNRAIILVFILNY